MMRKNIKNVLKAVFFGIFVSSAFYFVTDYHSYRPKNPVFVGSIVEPFKDEGLYIQAKAYDAHDSAAYLNHDLNRVGFKPVQVTIQNNTKNRYILAASGVDIPNSGTGKVASYLTARHIPKSIALKVAGFVFWPFMIPATIDSIVTVKSHFNLKADYYAKSIKEEAEIIVPYSTLHRVLFIPEDQFTDSFTLCLKDAGNGNSKSYPVKVLS